MALAARDDRAALVQRVLQQAFHLAHRLLLDERAGDDARLHAVADLQRLGGGGELLHEGVIDARLHIEAVGAHAGLAGITILGGDGAFHRLVEVGIVEHDEGRIAAQFERNLLHRVRALLHQQLAHRGGAGEGQLLHDGVRRHLAADGLCIAGHDVDDAAGNARHLRQHTPGKAGIGGQFRTACTPRCSPPPAPRRSCARAWRRGSSRRDGRDHATRLLGHENAAVRPRGGDGVA